MPLKGLAKGAARGYTVNSTPDHYTERTFPIMVEQSFWEMLRAKRDSLTKSGAIVADYLVQHAEDAQYLSISSLAKACGCLLYTSPSPRDI